MYGAQTAKAFYNSKAWFENDVEMYGAQTVSVKISCIDGFENDVEMYGAQTLICINIESI